MGFNRQIRKEFKKRGIITADVQKYWEDGWSRLLEGNYEELKEKLEAKKEELLNPPLPPPPTIDKVAVSAYLELVSHMDGKDTELPPPPALTANKALSECLWLFDNSCSMRGREYALDGIRDYLRNILSE